MLCRTFGGKIDRLVEFGGANSCFLETIEAEIAPREYHVVDTNAYGLSLLEKRRVRTHQQDCRAVTLDLQADVVFSIGLIEHFDRSGTREAILSHFAYIEARRLRHHFLSDADPAVPGRALADRSRGRVEVSGRTSARPR